MQQQPSGPGLHGQVSPGLSQPAGSPASARPPLPDRNVAATTIEDAYASFIMHCNPAVPVDTDTAALREAFRMPPKSGGKSFSTFALFELIRQLESKELKTWAELALKLGVEPPDQEKGQSSQKIQQYAVRLKRWMHSMHVDAFFDYLLNISHPYWTHIPTGSTPICEAGRDGVAAEDDMALRALLPHVRPKRGRRKPEEDDVNKSPSQRPRLDSPALADEFVHGKVDGLDPWSAHPDGRHPFFFPDPSRLGAPPVPTSWPAGDGLQTPLTTYPQSAITPSTRAGFWENEPRSAVTLSKSKATGRRHGPKVLSSAWRSGSGGSGKTRGRPPINRPQVGGSSEGPFFTFASEAAGSARPSPSQNSGILAPPQPRPTSAAGSNVALSGRQVAAQASKASSCQPTPPNPPHQEATAATSSSKLNAVPGRTSIFQCSSRPPNRPPPRPAKPSGLSLQVPQRPTGCVRLATPPPVVMVNGQNTGSGVATGQDHGRDAPHVPSQAAPAIGLGIGSGPASYLYNQAEGLDHVQFCADAPLIPGPQTTPSAGPPSLMATALPSSTQNSGPAELSPTQSTEAEDCTNVAEIEAFFADEMLQANWFDNQDKKIPPASLDEIKAIIDTILERLRKGAPTKQMFLINLAALAGGKFLMTNRKLKITRVLEESDRTTYTCQWELRYGGVKGTLDMKDTVLHEKWKKHPDENPQVEEAESLQISEWEKRYKELLGVVRAKDRRLVDLKTKWLKSLKDE